MNSMVFATEDAKKVIDAIMLIPAMILTLIGFLFVIVGIFKLILARALEDNYRCQKAAKLIMLGVILVIFSLFFKVIPLSDLFLW